MPLEVAGFEVVGTYPVDYYADKTLQPDWLSSLEELDADTSNKAYFHDKENGWEYLICIA